MNADADPGNSVKVKSVEAQAAFLDFEDEIWALPHQAQVSKPNNCPLYDEELFIVPELSEVPEVATERLDSEQIIEPTTEQWDHTDTNRVPEHNRRKRRLLQLEDDRIGDRKKRAVSCSSNEDDELSSHEIALSIDLILEQILRSLNTSELLNCRLVCQRWNSSAISQLQQKLRLNFSDSETVKQFIVLLQQQPPSSQPFPCSKFSFEKKNFPRFLSKTPLTSLSDPPLQEMLNIHGTNIRELELSFKNWNGLLKDLPSESIVMEEIRNLLIQQAPNLQYLKIDIESKVAWKSDQQQLNRTRSSPMHTNDPEFKEISSKCNLNTSFKSRLKVLHLPAYKLSASAKILEMIIQLSPKLEEIITNNNNYIYFLEPLHRLYLLQDLRFSPTTKNCIETFERIVDATGNDQLKLRQFRLYLSHHEFERGKLFEETEMLVRAVNIINKILAFSWDSLHTIDWRGVTFLPELKWPKIMPKVSKIDLRNPFHITGQTGQVFPPEFCWSESFPHLRHVSLLDRSKSKVGYFTDFITTLNIEPVTSVRTVRIQTANGSPCGALSAELNNIKMLFPNAQVCTL